MIKEKKINNPPGLWKKSKSAPNLLSLEKDKFNRSSNLSR